jgi:PAS domain S-box-containing protein
MIKKQSGFRLLRLIIWFIFSVLFYNISLYANPLSDSNIVSYKFLGDNNYPPYEFIDENGNPTGFNVDLLREIAQSMNFDVDIELGIWDEIRQRFEKGEADGLTGMFYSSERDEFLDFSIPHSIVVYAIFVHDKSPVKEKSDLQGRKIIVQSGDIMHDYLLDNQITSLIIPAENPLDALSLLSNEMYDCAIIGKTPGLYLIKNHNIKNIKVLSDIFTPTEYCFAVYNNPQLLSRLNEGLTLLQASGRYKEIYLKWFKGIDQDENLLKNIFRYIILVGILLIATAVIVSSWIIFLKRSVTNKTKELKREILQRENVEEALRNSEKNFHSLADNAFDGILINDSNGNYIYANSNAAEIAGYSVDELLQLNIKDLTPKDRIDSILKLSQDRIAGKDVQNISETFLICKTGNSIPIEVAASKTFWQGQPADLVFIRDISLRKQMENALLTSESNFRQIFENSNDAIYVRQDDRFVLVNSALERLSEYSKAELLSEDFNILEIVADENLEFLKDRIEKRHHKKRISKQFDFIGKTKSGKLLNLEISTSKIFWNGSPASLGIIRNITRYLRMQEEVFKAEKLESIGILAGGIAHDFNNILSVLLGNIQLIGSKAKKGENIDKYLMRTEETIFRATGLTQQLLTFSKGGEPVIEVSSLKDLINDIIPFTLTGSNIKYHITIEDDLLPVEMDANQISQVITNIVINSKQAMPDGGTIFVDSANVLIESDDVISNLAPGRYVMVSIKDQGIGIPDKIIDKVFDPFFSTKNSGSGLGLATCYSIMQKHKGHIMVQSVAGEGSTFTFFLPASKKVIKVKQEDHLKKKSTGKVLLMDDEDSVRDYMKTTLDELGFQVETAANGEEAIALYEKSLNGQGRYAFVILDLTIPGGIGGKEVIKHLKGMNPDIKAIAYSGYADDPVISHPDQFGFQASIPKPFKLNKLMEILSTIL